MKRNHVHISFYEMENEYQLFDLGFEKNMPVWDIVRFHIWMRLLKSNSPVVYKSAQTSSTLKNFMISLISYKKIFCSNYDNFFYTCSRLPDSLDKYYDPYFAKIEKIIPGKWVTYETMIGKDNYYSKTNIFDLLGYVKIFLNIFFKVFCLFNKKFDFELTRIVNVCNHTFKDEMFKIGELKLILSHFLFEKFFFKFILKRTKVKRVFYHGFSKSLARAAIELDIPCFEFQHGEITDATVCYIYPEHVMNLIFPRVLFTYSDFWTDKKHIPYKCVPIGSVHNYEFIHNYDDNLNSIVILSSPFQGQSLADFALKLSEHNSALLIYFKLHPMEFQNFNYYKSYFRQNSMIVLLDISYDIFKVLSLSNDFVLSYSTTLYEILHFKKNAFIFKNVNYDQEALLMSDLEVPMFDDVESFLEIKNRPRLKENSKIFFKSFDYDLFKKEVLNDISE